MALGKFNSLILGTRENYSFSISREDGIEMIFSLGKANLTNPIIAGNQQQEPVLENMSENGLHALT